MAGIVRNSASAVTGICTDRRTGGRRSGLRRSRPPWGLLNRPVMLVLCHCVLLLSGCHLTGHPLRQVTEAYDQGDAAAADEHLNRLAERRDAEADIVELDRAVIDLMAARPQESLQTLESLRERLDYLEQTDLREQTAATLQDDRRIAWSGREFEQRMIDNLQILAALLQGDDDAYALASRGMLAVHADHLDLQQLQPPPDVSPGDDSGESIPPEPADDASESPAPSRFTANQLTAWLAAAVHSERIQDADATDRLIRQAAAWDPSGQQTVDQLQTLGTSTSRNSGSLQVVVLAGRVSSWEPERLMPTTAALLAADRILSATGDHSLPPTTSPVLIARPVQQQYQARFSTKVRVEGFPAQTGAVLVDLNAAAWDSWEAGRDQQLARAVVRRVVKKSAVYGAKDALNVAKGSGTDLLLNVAGSFWESRERADLRHWTLLPAAIEVAQLELPAGEHQVTLQVCSAAAGSEERVSDQLQLPVVIEDGRNTFVVCFRPAGRLVGVQTSSVPL